MTTKVKIEVTQAHLPVLITQVLEGAEPLLQLHSLHKVGDSLEFYVHGKQHLVVRELSVKDLS